MTTRAQPPIIIRDEVIRVRVMDLIAKLDLRKPWEITVKPYRKKRTLSQNGLMHMWLGIIADHLGYGIDEVKDIYRDKFLPKVPRQFGDEERMVGRSTVSLDTAEMGAFCDKIYAHATSELGLLLPIPEELHQRRAA